MSADAASPFASVAEHYLAALRARGIERLFFNAGTDFAPLVEAYARAPVTNAAPFPEPIIATHENLAIGMAHGAHLVTGKPQALMVHVSVGTANTICGLMNAARERVPLLLTAGRSPLFETDALAARDMRIHWGQEMFDQGGIVRELVKWDYELRDARHVGDVVDRALTVAQSEPTGPVYLTLPREVLAEPATAGASVRSTSLSLPTAPQADRRAVDELAARLSRASLPVLVATASGADAGTVEALVGLCERHAIGYVEEQARYVNFPAGHALHLGYDLGSVLPEADVVCFLECDVPWLPGATQPRADAFVAHCGVDPGFARYPMRSHRSDLSITSASGAFIAALADALGALPQTGVEDRRQRIAAWAQQRRAARAASLPTDSLSRDIVAAALARALGPDAVLFSEYWAPPEALARTKPQTYFYLSSAGGLGWALPAALGAQLAAPERTVAALIGDGAYLFANPAACHHVAARYALPVLTVIYNNARWGAVDHATRMVYPDGQWRAQRGPSLSDLTPIPALEKYVEASGGYGERVASHADLEPAIERALHAVRIERRQAVLNVLGT
jgi:acetolactate synthase-1/2/3 large subunit